MTRHPSRRISAMVAALGAIVVSAIAGGMPFAGVAHAIAPPVNVEVPAITGTPTVGETLTATDGSWTGGVTSFAYQWEWCDQDDDCGAIDGATGSTYELTDDERGYYVRATVTATSPDGSTPATSELTDRIEAAWTPSVVTDPVLTGDVRVGETVTVSGTVWDGTPDGVVNAWMRCVPDGGGYDCDELVGETSASYTVVAADYGNLLVGFERPTGPGVGESGAAASEPVLADRPTNLAVPKVTGTTNVGATLTAATGNWTVEIGTIAFSYKWLRCDAHGASCAAITNAAAPSTYVAGVVDAGATIRVVVTATSVGGTRSVTSAPSPAIPGPAVAPPVNDVEQPVVAHDGSITISGSGYAPSSTVEVWLHSDPVFLGTVQTDANGAFSVTFAVPDGVEPGSHHIVLRGLDADGNPVSSEIPLEIAEPEPVDPDAAPGLPVTGTDSGALPLVGLVLVGIGAVLLASCRPRRCAPLSP